MISIDISSFFLTHDYYIKILDLLEITQLISNLCSLIQIIDNIVIKFQDIHD
ncbi:hypothetical protein EMCG_02392 [[Emmonsia] crescens]|uniref:Uncharacterized protein n=1 Tax=[Emmonsia] crescens TaxID=73230 RepID=A0A0G2HY68_9EURO|nr:hypothetical protein EMCG_02392 [Emmonsia crescens UAMH 3008]